MVDLKTIDAQLKKVGMQNQFIGRPEVRELCHILAPNEEIQHAVMGKYEGGFALIVATDHRVLLIDKKPWFLTMEDICYDMISEVDLHSRLIDSTASIITLNKTLNFTSLRRTRLRELVRYVQHQVMGVRNHEELVQSEQVHNHHAAPSFALQFAQNDSLQNDFLQDYLIDIKRHSLAHLAGKIATDNFDRPKQIVRPLFPRPSVTASYRSSSLPI